MSPLVYALVHFTFFYTCIEGLVVNLQYPSATSFLYKDMVLVLVYAGVIVPNLGRVLDPPPMSRVLTALLAFFGALLFLYLLVPSNLSLLSEMVAVKQRLFYIPLLVVGYYFVRSSRDLKGLIAAMAIYAIGVSIFGIYLFFAGPEGLTNIGAKYSAVFYTPVASRGQVSVWRVPGTFTSAGQFGAYLTFNVIAIAGMLMSGGVRRWVRIVGAVSIVMIVLAMLVSGSRAPMIVASVSVALAVLMSGRLARLGVWGVAFYAVLAYGFMYLGPGVRDRFDSIVSTQNIERFEHTYFGQLFMARLLENPLGSGLGLATIGARHFTEFSQLVFTESYFGVLAVETGFPGLLTFVGVAGAIVFLVVKHRSLMASSPDGPLWLGLASYVLLTIGVMPISTSIDHAPSNFYFWFSIGALVRMVELEYWRQWALAGGTTPPGSPPGAEPKPAENLPAS